MEIKNKIAIVTGATSGIGLATAKLLAEEGAKVALVARNEVKLAAISAQIPDSMFINADMSKGEEIKYMISEVYKHFGKIDILINCAGQGYDSPIEKTDIPTFRKILDLDVMGPVIAMEKVIPIMKKEDGGSIINISSGTALMALPNNAAYSGAKRALAQISLVAREELKDSGIKVSVVYPYITKTAFEINTIRDKSIKETPGEAEAGGPQPPDSAEFVANVIVEGIKSGEAEIYAHDWMKNMKP
ncbi:MAG: SDR family oxidoreductase [Candidatus Microgenomates bacterium]|jgi:short-subunit dehydrogenase